MRNSPLPAPDDPYEAITNSDMIVSQSFDARANLVRARRDRAAGRPVPGLGRL